MVGFRFTRIGLSVGRGGSNAYADVVAAQELLNTSLSTAHPLVVDGHCGLKTAAIEEAERRFAKLTQPDGRLDPSGPTLHAMNHTLRAPSTAPPPRPPKRAALYAASRPIAAAAGARFAAVGASPHGASAPVLATNDAGMMVGGTSGEITASAIKAAQATQRTWGVPASITLAQYIVESGAGHRMPHASNNPFGIKAGKSQPSVMAWTYEYLKDGTRIHILAPFRIFKDIPEAFDAHGKLLAHHPAYATARRHLDDARAYAKGLEGHYSTTKGYSESLIKTMTDHRLLQYDVSR